MALREQTVSKINAQCGALRRVLFAPFIYLTSKLRLQLRCVIFSVPKRRSHHMRSAGESLIRIIHNEGKREETVRITKHVKAR